MNEAIELKSAVRDFWDEASCGEVYATGTSTREYYDSHSNTRYTLEPYIIDFARFSEGLDKDVLEVGVGMGADHLEWAKSQPRSLTGIDLTPRAVEHTSKRLAVFEFQSDLSVGDAENLPCDDESFDLVYSWGVLHHSPDTQAAIDEVYRVLRPKGSARIMIYHSPSLAGYMLWIRYGLLTGHPFRSLNYIYANYMESPGTKAYSVKEARSLMDKYSNVRVLVQLSFGDLLEGEAGQRHHGVLLTVARKLWPRWLLRRLFSNFGTLLLIEATK